MDILAGIESGKYYLGKLCPKSHEWESNGLSARYKSNNACCICSSNPPKKIISESKRVEIRERAKSRYQSDPVYRQKIVESARLSRVTRKEEINCQRRERYKKDPTKFLQRRSDYYNKNKDLVNQKGRDYGKAHKNEKMACNRARKSRIKQNHHVPYSSQDLAKKMEPLGSCCLYCQSPDDLTVDHIVPVVKGGSDCLGNVVYACKRCNSSKSDKDALDWFKSQHFYSKKREKVIISVIGDTSQIPLF